MFIYIESVSTYVFRDKYVCGTMEGVTKAWEHGELVLHNRDMLGASRCGFQSSSVRLSSLDNRTKNLAVQLYNLLKVASCG